MFLCEDAAIPPEPQFAPLGQSEFVINDNLQIVHKDTGAFFNFFFSDNDRANTVRKEIVHEGVRLEIVKRLEQFGVLKTYLHGPLGDHITTDKPEGAHVAILTTKVRALRCAKDVIIVCGEQQQNSGVWAWREVMRELGLQKGSAIGLAASVQAFGQSMRADFEEDMIRGQILKEDDITPGIIILNPGEGLYSHMKKEAMTKETWISRERPTAVSPAYKVQEENKIPGHGDGQQHLDTFVGSVLPKLVGTHARLYFIGIASGAELLINSLDRVHVNNIGCQLTRQIQQIALVESTHDPAQIKSQTLRNTLNVRAKSYVSNGEKAKGQLIKYPDILPASTYVPEVTKTRKQTHDNESRNRTMRWITGDVKDDEEVIRHQLEMAMRPNAPSLTQSPATSRSASLEAPPNDMPDPDALAEGLETSADKSPVLVCVADDEEHLQTASHPASPSGAPADEPNVPTGADLTFDDNTASMISLREADNEKMAQSILRDDYLSEPTLSKHGLGQRAPDDEENNSDDGAFDYSKLPVSCPTYSAGNIEVTECVWPAIQDDIIRWFTDKMEEVRAFEVESEATPSPMRGAER